jgi:hypothetical protein
MLSRRPSQGRMSPKSKIAWTILIVWVVINVVAWRFVRAYENYYDKKASESKGSRSWADWQGQIKDKITRKMSETVIIGSHDAGADILQYEKPFLLAQEFQAVIPFLDLIKRTISDLSVTQNHSIFKQCLEGVRYFDIRVQMAEDGIYYLWHGFRSRNTLDDALRQFKTFLELHPTESLVLWIRFDDLSTDALLANALNQFVPIRNRMVKNVSESYQKMTVKESAGKIFVWTNQVLFAKYPDIFGNADLLTGSWPNFWKPDDVVKFVQTDLEKAHTKLEAPHEFYALPWTATPQKYTFVMNVLSRIALPGFTPSIRWKAQVLNHKLDGFLEKNFQLVHDKASSINMDFPEKSTVYSWIEKLNNL